LSARVFAKTSTSLAPASPIVSRRLRLAGRKNGFVAFSSASVDGTVGLPAARSFATSATRSASARLPGSTVTAKRPFDWVY